MVLHSMLSKLARACLLGFATVLVTAIVSESALAATLERYAISVETAQGTVSKVYAEIHRGRPEAPTLVLVNGLVYDLNRWNQLTDELAAQGFTVVRYAFSAQPESLRLLTNKDGAPAFLNTGLTLEDLSEELHQVIRQLGLRKRVHIVGLSFGASVAAEYSARHPERVESTIFMSPLVIPLDYYDPSGYSLRTWLNTVRFWENAPCDFYRVVNPWLCSARDYWYDAFYNYFYEHYLFERVQSIPEGVDEKTYKKAIFHLVRAARDFDLRTYARRLSNVHMLVASEDSSPLLADQERAWNEVAPAEKRSFVVFNGATHALPDETPVRAAQVLTAIAKKHPDLQKGQRIEIRADR